MTLVSVVQMNSQDDIESNFQVIESLIQQSKAQNASLIVFPKTLFVLRLANSVKQQSNLSRFNKDLRNLRISIKSGLLQALYRAHFVRMVPSYKMVECVQ